MLWPIWSGLSLRCPWELQPPLETLTGRTGVKAKTVRRLFLINNPWLEEKGFGEVGAHAGAITSHFPEALSGAEEQPHWWCPMGSCAVQPSPAWLHPHGAAQHWSRASGSQVIDKARSDWLREYLAGSFSRNRHFLIPLKLMMPPEVFFLVVN